MILLPRAVRVYVATTPVNLHRSFDGLAAEARSVLGLDPLSGHVFVFLNRRRSMMKLLVWTRGGFTIVHKRLERGTFTFSRQLSRDVKQVEIEARAVDAARRHRRFAGEDVGSLGAAGAPERGVTQPTASSQFALAHVRADEARTNS